MITINRSKLVEELYQFAKEGSGLVIGKPGVGKSYVLKKLKDRYIDNNILAVMIKIDNLLDFSDASIQSELGVSENWIETFKQIRIKDHNKALLIFDAFDAARNEDFRNGILKQIQIAKRELSTKWNIIVSVRTYDAAKSQKLISLFPASDDFSNNISCRKHLIPELEETEVISGIGDKKLLLKFYLDSDKKLHDILRIPFFLILAEKIIPGSSMDELKKLRSETQLLKMYWEKVVIGTENHLLKEKILFSLTKFLIESKKLSCPKQSFLETFDSTYSDSFEYLRSANVIDEVSMGSQLLVFSHNILFDYAVSSLYIKPEVSWVLAFIKEDSSRPFFLRPSFVYFFTQLWYEQRELFWKFLWAFYSEKEKQIQLFVRLVLVGVIASEYDSTKEIKPILEYIRVKSRNEFIRNFLQSLRFIRLRNFEQDIYLLEYLSSNLNQLYIWDFAFLLDRGINDKNRTDDFILNYGIAARNFLSFALDKNKIEPNQFLEKLAATRGVELVCKTYQTDIQASRSLIKVIFKLLKEPNFEIYYFINLSEYAKNILPHDPNFVSEIYKVIFGHHESSDAKTTMGNSVLMNFMSNRRQDFEMSHFKLLEFYPTFLSFSPENAIPIGLIIVNNYSAEYSKGYSSIIEKNFPFKNRNSILIDDYSTNWEDNINYHRPAGIANKIIEYFEKSLTQFTSERIVEFLDLYVSNAKCGYSWKVIIEFGYKALPVFKDYYFDFCIEDVFLTSIDTSYDAAELIEVGSKHFSDKQISLIEKAIHRIARNSEKVNTDYFLTKYLARLPIEKLKLVKSKRILNQKGPAENERPFTSTFSSTEYTTEMWLKDKGVNTDDTLTADLLQKSNELKKFNSTWMNQIPSKNDYIEEIKKAEVLFLLINEKFEKINEDVKFSVLCDIAHTFSIISRNINSLDEIEFSLLEKAIIVAFESMSKYDLSIGEDASPATGYSPTPNIISSEALANIVSRDDSDKNIQLLISAINGSNSIVRFNAIRSIKVIKEKQPQLFRDIVYTRLKEENDPFVCAAVLQNIPFTPYSERDANELLEICNQKESFFGFNNSFLENFALRAIWLYTTHKNELADQIIMNAYKREEFCRTILFNGFNDFKVSSLMDYKNSNFYIDSIIKWTLHYLDKIGEELKGLGEIDFTNENPVVKEKFNLIDLIVQRIYFVFDKKARGRGPHYELPDEKNKLLYDKIKPVFEKIILISSEIRDGGLMVGHTAHYLMETFNIVLPFDAKVILGMVTKVTQLAFKTGYTFDSLAIKEVVELTEKLLADNRDLLSENESFDNLIDLLDIYMNSGWVEALELLWKLDEIFK